MGFFGKLWNSAKTLGKKVLGWGHKAHAIGKKAKTHYERARVIGQKVQTGYHHAKHLYHEASHLKTPGEAVDFAKREAQRAPAYRRSVEGAAREAAQLGRDARRNFRL